MVDHDAKPGRLTRCQISGSENINLIIDLGNQPPCDALLPDLNEPEISYPLALWHCPDSGLAQLSHVVSGDKIYPPSYPYRSGISKPLEQYQRAFADGIIDRWPRLNPLVVDIGSNDGTLLSGFKRRGCRVIGVEPTDVATIARDENDVETIQAFFTEDIARQIVESDGEADFVTMTNVFAHMADLREVMRGILTLMKRDGVFITESHYLLDVLEKNQFDTIYHEHIRTYSLKALVNLFGQYGMEVFDVQRAERYGGNIRAYVARKGVYPVERCVGELLLHEEAAGLHKPESWLLFRERVQRNRDKTMEFLYRTKCEGRSIVGCSAPGRASTLINYYGITPDMVPYTGELHNSLKLDKFLPGSHIRVSSNANFVKEQPDFIILFAWHYAEVIVKRLREEGVRSRLIVPLPEFRVIEA